MIDAIQIKAAAKNLGADLCGIAPGDRFNEAPEGFRPMDIYSECRSVIVFAKKLPTDAIFAASCVPYTMVNNVVTQMVDGITVELALYLERMGVRAVSVPSDDPYEHWEQKRQYGRAILSMRHAAWLAGLGVLGKNTLLINEDLGNMIQIGAVLVDAELEPDEIARYSSCPEGCSLCIDACPQGALDGITVNQELCRPLSNFRTEKGYVLKKCSICRRVCPNLAGIDKLKAL
ncbi:MAG: epoxyqueuosine reductase [Bacillota bacterium]|nr:epoxyqueuosine reductase [Bacillota bacterium]